MNDQIGHRDKALLLTGFAGAFRRSEIVAINCTDLEFVIEGVVITIGRSKTDQEGQGRKIGIAFDENCGCPVEALRVYMAEGKIVEGPVFRSATSKDELSLARLSDRSVANIIKQRINMIGLNPDDYSGHSLRSGFATSAANAGFASVSIMQQTGHKSVAVMERYVRGSVLFNNSVLI